MDRKPPRPAFFRPALSNVALAAAMTLAGLLGVLPLARSASADAPPNGRASFAPCVGAHRVTCIVDGDTFWYRGEKIRIADINAPELSHPQCAAEARLAAAATARLAQLLNAGDFTLAPWPQRTIDRYGRSLYVVERGGRSLGLILTREGLAERWRAYRRSWCSGQA
jgi:endonuclease YncB( thermonuclease family)